MADGGITAGIIAAGIGAAAGAVIASQMTPSMPKGPDYTAGTPKKGANVERPVIYGRARCDGHFIMAETLNQPLSQQTIDYVSGYLRSKWGYTAGQQQDQLNAFEKLIQQKHGADTSGEYKMFVLAFGEGPINAFKQIYIDDVPVFARELSVSNGIVGYNDISEEFRNHIQLEFSNGDRVDPYWLSMAGLNSDNKWTPEYRGFGLPMMALKVKLDPEGRIKSEYFTVQADIEGRLVKDIRYANPQPGYRTLDGKEIGRNGALICYDYLTEQYGAAMNDYELDIATFIQAANYCETNHLPADGVVNQSQEPIKSLDDILSSFGGALTQVNGVIGLVIDQPAVTSYTFSTTGAKQNIKEGNIEYRAGDVLDYFNQLEVTVKDRDSGKADVVLYPPTVDDAVIKKDGKNIVKRLELPFTKDKSAIDFLASREYMRTQYNDYIKFTADLNGFLVTVFDVIQVDIPEINLSKQFRILKHECDFKDGSVEIEAIEYNAAIYSAYWTGITTPTTPSKPIRVNQVDNLRTQIVEFNDGLVVELAWDGNDKSATDYDVYYKLSSDPDGMFKTKGSTRSTSFMLYDLEQTYYDFAVAARNIVGNTSKWTYLRNVDLKDDTVLPAVTNLKLKNRTTTSSFQTNDRDFIIQWDSMLDSVVKKFDVQFNGNKKQTRTVRDVMRHYAVDVYHGGNFKQRIISAIPEVTYTFEQNKVNGLSRSVEFRVVIVSKGGAESPIGTTSKLTVQNPQIAVPTGVQVTGGIAGVSAKWIHPTDPDYAGTQVHLSKTPNYVPSSATLQVQPMADDFWKVLDPKDKSVYFLKIGHYDIFGADSINFTQEYVVSQHNIRDELTDLTKDNLAKSLVDEINGLVPRTEFNNVIKTEVGNAIIEVNQDINNLLKPQITDLQTKLDKETADRKAVDASLSKQVQDGDTALSTRLDVVKASADKANADIVKTNADVTSVKSAYAAADTALSTKIDTVAATTAKNAGDALAAAIKTEQTARATGDSAIATRLDTVEAAYKKADTDLKADYTQRITVVSNETKQLASRVDTLKVEIKTESLTEANKYTDDQVAAGDAATLSNANKNTATTAAKTLADANTKSAQLSDAAKAAAIAEAKKLDAATLVSAKAEVTNEANVRQAADEVIATDVKNLRSETTSKANQLQSQITTANTTITDLKTSTATSISTLTSSVNGLSATVKTTAETTANIDKQMKSKFVIQTDANGVIAGIGLMSDAATKSSQVVVQAQNFLVTTDAKATRPVFEIRGDQTLIQRSMIGELEATNIKAGAIQAYHCQANMITANSAIIQDGAITNAKIGNIIQSANYVPGQAGWMINKAGNSEFRNVNVSGTITGSYITGSVVEGALMISNNYGVPMTPTEADKPSGVRSLCQPFFNFSVSSGAVNATVVRPAFQLAAPFNYTGSGTMTYQGNVVAYKQYERFRKQWNHFYFDGNATLAYNASVRHTFVNVEVWLVDKAGSGFFYKVARLDLPGAGTPYTRTGYSDQLSGTPTLPNVDTWVNGIHIIIERAYVMTSDTPSGGPNTSHDGHYMQTKRTQTFYPTITRVWTAGEFDSAYNNAGSSLLTGQFQVTTNMQGSSWGGGYVTVQAYNCYTRNVNT